MATFRDPKIRPQVQPPNIEVIPLYVQRFPHWVLWRFDWNEGTGTWAKVPYDAGTLNHAKCNDPSTWSTFEEAVLAYREQSGFDGIGFVFSAEHDDLCGIDVDSCISETGELDATKTKLVEQLDSYTELSVSGTGLHVIVRGASGKGRRQDGIEIYDRLRYFTFSGRAWHSPPKQIHWRQTQIEALKAELFPEPKPKTRPRPNETTASIDDLLQLAFKSKNGDSIIRLYQGQTEDYGGDDSAADLALCSKLAFWSGGSPSLLNEMFRGSRLYRDKWNERHSADGRTYGQMTVDKAFASCSTFYTNTGNTNGNHQSAPDRVLPRGIYSVRDLRENLFRLYETGRQPGEHPGWEVLGRLYTIKKRQFTVVTGIPGSGKTAVLDTLIINLARKSDWRFAVCSVENQPLEDHLSVLLEIYTGLPFNSGPTPRMDRDLVNTSLDWFEEHVVFVLPDESERTLPGIMALVDELDVDGVIVDPWNELEHRRPPQMTETEYISQSLSKMRHYARTRDQHWWLVAHPTKLQKDKNGKYLVPTLYDIAGSAHFRNKCDFGLVLWRDAEDPANPTTVYVQKVRYRWCGQIGSCDLYFDGITGRFFEK